MRDSISVLKRRVAALEGASGPRTRKTFALGMGALDHLLGGGLEHGALHEIYPATTTEAAAAGGFAAGLVVRAAGAQAVVWVRHDYVDVEGGGLYGAGLVEFGLDPDRLIFVRLRTPMDVLRAGAEAAACKSVGVVLMEVWGAPSAVDLTASRRLSLAAAASGATVLMVRSGVAPAASAAVTRWQVGAARSAPMEANAPGRPTFSVALKRHRNGLPERSWILEWDRDQRAFNDAAALSGGVAASVGGRPRAARNADQRWSKAG